FELKSQYSIGCTVRLTTAWLFVLIFFTGIRGPTRPTLFPYTTLFRSTAPRGAARRGGPLVAPGAWRRRAPAASGRRARAPAAPADRKSTRLNSSHLGISYAVFCLKKKK